MPSERHCILMHRLTLSLPPANMGLIRWAGAACCLPRQQPSAGRRISSLRILLVRTSPEDEDSTLHKDSALTAGSV